MTEEFDNIANFNVKDGIANGHRSEPPEHLAQFAAVSICVAKDRCKKFTASCALAGSDGAVNESVETLINGKWHAEPDLLVTALTKKRSSLDRVIHDPVTPSAYYRNMSEIRMSNLLGTILASSDAGVDLRRQWPLHEALRELFEWSTASDTNLAAWRQAGYPELKLRPDPEVGLRAQGVTTCLWDMVTDKTLRPDDDGGMVRLTEESATRLRRIMLRLDVDLAARIQAAGQRLRATANAVVNA